MFAWKHRLQRTVKDGWTCIWESSGLPVVLPATELLKMTDVQAANDTDARGGVERCWFQTKQTTRRQSGKWLWNMRVEKAGSKLLQLSFTQSWPCVIKTKYITPCSHAIIFYFNSSRRQRFKTDFCKQRTEKIQSVIMWTVPQSCAMQWPWLTLTDSKHCAQFRMSINI